MKKLLLALFCLLSIARGNSNAQCSAHFGYSVSPGDTLVYFSDSSNGTLGHVTYHWDFGAGIPIDTSRNPVHAFPFHVAQNVCLTITDSTGCTDTFCDSILVSTHPTRIEANISLDSMSLYNCTSPHSVHFFFFAYAIGYSPADSIKIEINFGDGVDSIFYHPLFPNPPLQGTFNHEYLNAGTYTPQFIVTGPDLNADTITTESIIVSSSCGSISGTVYNDLNNNCTFDSGEELPNISLGIYNGNQFAGWASTDINGLYSFNVPSGNTYEVRVNSSGGIDAHFVPTCPPSGILTISNVPSTGNDFGVACPPDFDLQGSVHGWVFRPGFTASVCVYAFNQNCNSPTGQIEITLSPNTTPLPDTSGIGYTINGNTVTYPISGPDYHWSFCIPVLVSQTSQIGDSVCVQMNITPTAGDAHPENNTGTFCFAIRNSYDPNDKAVSPAGVGMEGYIRPNTDLTYTIRFQNTGNAEAINIYILDSLNSNLDPASVKVVGTSHDVVYSLLSGNIMRFTYDNINLADSNTSEPASHGYVSYTVRQLNNVPQLAEITNTAGIYFDFNPPIITNTTLNTVDQFLSVKTINGFSSTVNIYPNPANQKCNLFFNDNRQRTISISNILGEEILRFSTYTDSYSLQTEKFAEGIYTVQVKEENNKTVTGKLIISH